MSLREYLIKLTVENEDLTAEEKAEMIERFCEIFGKVSL